MPELTTSLIINLVGNLTEQGQRFQRSLLGIGKAAKEGAKEAGEAHERLGHSVEWLMNRYTALGGVIGLGEMVHEVLKVDEAFARLGARLGKTKEQMREWRETFAHVADNPKINLSLESLQSAGVEFLGATQDEGFLKRNLPTLGQALQVAGPGAEREVADMFVGLRRMGLTDPAAVRKQLEVFYAQGKGKQGAIPFAQVAGMGGGLAAFGGTATEWGALMQTAMKAKPERGGVMRPELAAMMVNQLDSALTDKATLYSLAVNGAPALDAQGKRRPMGEWIQNLMERTGGQEDNIAMTFHGPDRNLLNVIAKQYRETGSIGGFRELLNAHGSGQLAAQAAAIAQSPAVEARTAVEKANEAARKATAGPISKVVGEAGKGINRTISGADEGGWRGYFEAIGHPQQQALADLPQMLNAARGHNPLVNLLRRSAAGTSTLDVGSARRGMTDFADARGRLDAALQQPKGKVEIEFKNAPPGMRVKRLKADGLDLDVHGGSIMRGP